MREREREIITKTNLIYFLWLFFSPSNISLSRFPISKNREKKKTEVIGIILKWTTCVGTSGSPHPLKKILKKKNCCCLGINHVGRPYNTKFKGLYSYTRIIYRKKYPLCERFIIISLRKRIFQNPGVWLLKIKPETATI